MKIRETNKTSFLPIEVTITIETPEDLQELFHRFNFMIGYGKTMYPKYNYSWHGNGQLDLYECFKCLLNERNVPA
jgi:hypothetical protein